MRYEVANNSIKRSKKILGRKKVTLLDLMQKETHIKFREDLLNTYDKIVKMPHHSDNILRNDMLEMLAYSHPAMIKYDQANLSPWKFKQHRKKGKQLMEKHARSSGSFHQKIRQKIVEKLDHLLNYYPCNIREELQTDLGMNPEY